MPPANSDQLKSYLAISNEVKQDYIAVETYEARDTPFDITNQYSFLGSLVRKINPIAIKSTASVSGALTNLPGLFSTALVSLVPNASAVTYQNFNEARFSRCEDEGYRELGLDADIFCNIRYHMSPEQLAMEPDTAAVWMIENGHIEEDGSPKSEQYEKWIKFCTEREDGWGETSDSEDNSDEAIGKTCVQQNEFTKHAPVFWMDKAITDASDNQSTPSASTAFWDPNATAVGQY